MAGDGTKIFGVTDMGDGGTTDYASFDVTGHKTMSGDARPWRDELGDAVALQQSGVGISRNATNATVEFALNANTGDFMYTNVQLNHDRDLSAAIYPHVHWIQTTANAPNFLFRYRWNVNGGLVPATWSNLVCTGLAFPYTSGSTLHQISYSAAITAATGSKISDVVQFRIMRDSTNNSTLFSGVDTHGAIVGVMSFDCHFQINSLGSTEEYIK